MASAVNRVVVLGNLTADPELRPLPSGSSVCQLRVAVNERVRDRETQEWGERANYFNVTVWGAQGENCARYLSKGRGVAVDGRLRWREYEVDGQKRQAVEIVAETVQFLAGANGDANGRSQPAGSDVPVDPADFGGPVGVEDDIPF